MARAGASYDSPEFPRLPAVGMTQHDIWAYCFWFWMRCPYRFRLPYEAEWNLACHGGRPQYFPWSESSPAVGNFNSSGVAPVDAFAQVEPYGTVGQAGNVWEYTSSLYLGKAATDNDDLILPDLPFVLLSYDWWRHDGRLTTNAADYLEDLRFVLKGGSWGGGLEYAVVGMRIYSSLYNLGEYAGFRMAIDAVWDVEWQEYRPRASPFVAQSLQLARPYTATELQRMRVDYTMSAAIDFATSSSCPSGFAPTPQQPKEPDQVSTWIRRMSGGLPPR